ncbi:MAG: hypothetical protein ACM3X9_07490 [Bacillota bacterium]
MEVEDLLEEADQLYDEAEQVIVKEPSVGLKKFQDGVSNLLSAFLLVNDEKAEGDLRRLFKRCLGIEPEFAAIEDELDYIFMPHLAEADSEIICDAANEIWDFVIDLLVES